MPFVLLLYLFVALLPAIGLAEETTPSTARAPTPGVPTPLPPAPARPQRDAPVHLEADRMEGHAGQDLKARGTVRLERGGLSLFADEVEYLQPTNEVTGSGNVRLERSTDRIEGDQFRYDLDNDEGFVDKPKFFSPKNAKRPRIARGNAGLVKFLGPNRERFSDARYTTCEPGQDDWFLRVRDLQLDRKVNIGEATNATVEFKGVPIFYWPWLTFPLGNERKSGFLTATFGTTGRSGLEAEIPYYWNIAPNMDATFSPRLLSRRGILLGNEFRYLYPNFNGELHGDLLPNDRQTGDSRSLLAFRHQHALGAGWSAFADVNRVSDDNYFRDLSTRITETSTINLPRDVGVNYAGSTWSFLGRTLSYQTLQDPTQAFRNSLYRLRPQLQITGVNPDVRGFAVRLFGEATDFGHPTDAEGRRFVLNPEASYTLGNAYSFITPKLGYHYTRYDLRRTPFGEPDITRSLPIFSVDSGLFFERDTTFRQRAYRQTLEPRLFYVNVPFEDQSRIPRFTTGLADFNFVQLFTENRFSGPDRVGDANQVTLATTTRFIEEDTGIERLRAIIGQRYNFRRQRVTLDGPNVADDRKSSDLLLGLSGQLSTKWSLDSALQFNPENQHLERVSAGVRYSPAIGKVVNLSYRSASKTAVPAEGIPEQADLSFQWPVGRNWYGLGRVNYSFRDSRLLEGLLGVEYNRGCWELRLVAHRFTTAEQLVSTSFFIQLELNGLSRFGTNPLEVLKQNIPGYVKTQEIQP